MTDSALVFRNLLTWWKGRRGLAGLLAVCVLLMAWASVVVTAAKGSVQQSIADDVALKSLTVESGAVQGGAGITRDEIQNVSTVDHVVSVHTWTKTGGGLALDQGEFVPVWAVPYFEATRPPLTYGGLKNGLGEDEVILPEAIKGHDLSSLVGETLSFEFTEKTGPAEGQLLNFDLTVVGTYDSTIGGIDGPSAVYVSQDTSDYLRAANDGITVSQLRATRGYEKLVVIADTVDSVESIQRQLSAEGYYVISVASRLTALPAVVELIDLAFKSLAVITILVCAVAGMSIASSLVVGRIRQIGLLKALGFTGARIVRIMGLELAVFGLAAGAGGLVVGMGAGVGTVLNGELFKSLGVEAADAPVAWVAALPLGLIPAVALLAGAAWPLYRVLNVMPDISMRDVRGQ